MTIENRDFLAKSGELDADEANARTNRQLTYFVCVAFVASFLFFIVCCLLMRCKKDHNNNNTRYNKDDKMLRFSNHQLPQNGSVNSYNNHQFEYSAPIRNGGTSIVLNNKEIYKETYKYSPAYSYNNVGIKQNEELVEIDNVRNG